MLLGALGCMDPFELVGFSSPTYTPRSGITGSYGGSIFRFFENSPYCFLQWLHQFIFPPIVYGTSQVALLVNNPSANAEDIRDPWLGKIPWRRAWQPTPVFSPGESHGQRSLAGYSSWGCEELDTTAATEHSRTTVCQRVPFALHPCQRLLFVFFS